MGEPPEGQLNAVVSSVVRGGAIVPSLETIGSKRQRRPSVRLGDIGGDRHQLYDSHVRRATAGGGGGKQLKHQAGDHKKEGMKSSKSRILMNMSGGNSGELNETLDENLDGIAIGSWKVKESKRRGPVKRARSNWASKNSEISSGDNNNNIKNNNNNNNSGNFDQFNDNDSKNFEGEDLDSGLKENSVDDDDGGGVGDDDGGDDGDEERDVLYYDRRGVNVIRNNKDQHSNDGLELSGPSDNEPRGWSRGRGNVDGVRIWLNSLGLGRYAPVFEVHEVDDEVLPMLTLEDLKDMGINAVGSRRKMFCAIQKLGKGFS